MQRPARPTQSPNRRPRLDAELAGLRADRRVARVVRAWRALTTAPGGRRTGPGGRTLVACSGGADSSALLLALGVASRNVVVGHVVHDLRPAEESLADRDAARALAVRLGLPFVETEVRVRGQGGNLEAAARRARYAALAEMADAHGCRFIATAHHADDQLETMLMALLRGAGPRGLSGVAVKRKERVGDRAREVWVIRPLLGDGAGTVPASTRADAEAICRLAHCTWRVDASNADTRLLRNALRSEVLPRLEGLRPGASVRAARCGVLLRDSAQLVRNAAAALWDARRPDASGTSMTWPRPELHRAPAIVLGEWLRVCASPPGPAHGRVSGKRRIDRLSRSALAPVIRAIRDESTDPREWVIGPLRVRVTARLVRVSPAGAATPPGRDSLSSRP